MSLQSITMTAEQTAVYDGDGAAARELMAALTAQAQQIADESGDTVEVYTDDGIVAQAVTPRA